MATSLPSKYSDTRGFMLIEVLVALFIIALLMAALIKSTTDNTRDMIILKNKTIGSWVAANMIANIQLGIIPPPTSDSASKQSAKIPMLGQTWYAAANFQPTTQKNVWRIDVEVKPTSFTTQSVVHVFTYFSPMMTEPLKNPVKDNE